VPQRHPPRALLVDLDGVLRRWDPAPMISVELAYGLPPAALLETSMSWDIYRPAMAGELSDAEWMRLVAERLPIPAGPAEALALVREIRAAGRTVGLATNATDRLRDDLAALGLTDEFDVVASSWELKVHKPAPEFFERACELVDEQPQHVFFVDDDDRVVRGARAEGLSAYRWSGPQHLPYLRRVFDLPA
jgi:putative hydrolase of the HAD superfamily